jgi:hypothetical protein
MTKTETTILASKTPADYIDRSLKARITPAAKAKLARLWMESTGYTKEDILMARNRHPYWKRKKMEGSADRTRRRLAAHDYSSGVSVQWDSKLVSEFLRRNKRGPDGRYEWKDWQLAERFGATIPSIQYMRRKLSKVNDLLGGRASQDKVVEYLLCAESVLARGKAAVEEINASRADPGASGKKASPRGRAGSKSLKVPAKGAKAKGKKVKTAKTVFRSPAKAGAPGRKIVRKGKKR